MMDYSRSLMVVGLVMSFMGSGCASMMGSKMQEISIETTSKGDRIINAQCSLNNSEGTWQVTTPGSATVHKSVSDLNVQCEKNPLPHGQTVVESSVNSAMMGNVILPGGLIGAAIDAGTGAGFDYPSMITVAMGETTGKASNIEAPQEPHMVAELPENNFDYHATNVGAKVGLNDCNVKGVERYGEKFYYIPDGIKYYETVVIPAKDEKWFCTEEEARQAGFRAIIN